MEELSRSPAVRIRYVSLGVVVLCVFVVGMLGSVPLLLNLAREMPAISRLGGDQDDDAVRGGPVTLPGAFTYQQQRPLSCEYASVHIAATLAGYSLSEYEIESVVPHSPNPHWGYRGNIMGTWGNTDDYGVYNEPLAEGLGAFGIEAEAFYATGRERLTNELDAGRPVVVWLGLWGDGGTFDAFTDDGTRFQLTTGMHVMVAYGYDEASVYITDPGKGVFKQYEWAQFMSMWDVMDGMALSVYPQ